MAVSSQSPAFGNVRFYFLYSKSGCSNTFNPFLPVALNTGCYSNISHRGTSARCGQIRYSKRAVCLLLFRASILGYGGRRSANSKRNWSSSPLYAIHPGRTTIIQPVDFNSCSIRSELFKDRTGNIPRQGSGSSCRLSQPEAGVNPFHRKHHKASNASSERRSNKIVGCTTIPFLFSRIIRIRLNG